MPIFNFWRNRDHQKGKPSISDTTRQIHRQWAKVRKTRVIPSQKSGNVEFFALEPDDLQKVAVVAQALDNQWVSRALLQKMLNSRKLEGLDDVANERRTAVRAEYLRSLITTEQVIINRAFFINSDVIRQDYEQPGSIRQAFIDLLSDGVIVPGLLFEKTPVDEQRFTTREFEAWRRVCEDVRLHCVRLSWDDQENTTRVQKELYSRFGAWIQTMNRIQDQGNFDSFIFELGLKPEEGQAFQERLKDIARWSIDQPTITREKVYNEFIVAPGTPVVEGKYDPAKPFSGTIKQLVDLSYSVNLPDALGRYALTPLDSLPRTALQELTIRFNDKSNTVTPAELKTLLQRDAFAQVSGLGGAFLQSMANLTLNEVKLIRSTDEWHAYIQDVQSLLENPLEFNQRLRGIYQRYVGLGQVITSTAQQFRQEQLERWQPAINLIVNIGAAVVQIVWNPFGPSPVDQFVVNMLGNVTTNAATVIARLIIGGVTSSQAQAQLDTSIDFMRAKVDDAQAFWNDLQGELGIKRQTDEQRAIVAHRQDIYDPNINYSEDIAEVGATI